MKLTVCMITYNHENYIEECLNKFLQVQELQEVVKYSRDDAGKHQDRSRAIINSLNNAINSLEEVAVEFVLHEQTDQNLCMQSHTLRLVRRFVIQISRQFTVVLIGWNLLIVLFAHFVGLLG